MTTTGSSAARRTTSAVRRTSRPVAGACTLLLGGTLVVGAFGACSSSDTATGIAPTSASTSKPTASAAKPKASASATKTSAAPPTTSSLGAFPPVLSSSASPVPEASIRGLADLPAAFQCPAVPAAISIPSSTKGPASVVCTSKLAGEALFLWFVDSPDARFLALQAAMATAKNVHGGPTWVAGGMIDPAMGSVGGDVYKTTPTS